MPTDVVTALIIAVKEMIDQSYSYSYLCGKYKYFVPNVVILSSWSKPPDEMTQPSFT